MIYQLGSTVRRCLVLALALAAPAFGQIAQNRPELCGKTGESVPLPSFVSGVSSDAHSTLSIQLNGYTAKVEMPGDSQILQVCPISEGRLLVFGAPAPEAYDIYVVKGATGAVMDSFDARSPALSPNQSWLAARRLNTPSAELEVSEQYMLYSLNRSALENRSHGTGALPAAVTGRVMFPVVPNHVPFENYGVSPEQVHTFEADSFFWSANSKAIVFADRTRAGMDVVLIVLERDDLQAFVHPLLASEACDGGRPERIKVSGLSVAHATIAATADAFPDVRMEFRAVDGSCKPKPLMLHSGDFRPAETEQHKAVPSKKPAQRKNLLP